LRSYTNTDFVNFTMGKGLFKDLERVAKKLETSVVRLLYNAILQAINEENYLTQVPGIPQLA
jgi:hypothetical protein